MSKSNIKPSQLLDWNEIDKSKAYPHKNPEWYCWYKEDGKFYPHRKPTVIEICNDKFNN